MSNNSTNTATITPYGAAKLVNEALCAAGIEKVLPPQMFYNYTSARIRKGKAPLIECAEDGKILVEALTTWTDKYIAKNS